MGRVIRWTRQQGRVEQILGRIAQSCADLGRQHVAEALAQIWRCRKGVGLVGRPPVQQCRAARADAAQGGLHDAKALKVNEEMLWPQGQVGIRVKVVIETVLPRSIGVILQFRGQVQSALNTVGVAVHQQRWLQNANPTVSCFVGVHRRGIGPGARQADGRQKLPDRRYLLLVFILLRSGCLLARRGFLIGCPHARRWLKQAIHLPPQIRALRADAHLRRACWLDQALRPDRLCMPQG